MAEHPIDRRKFLTTTAGVAGLSLLGAGCDPKSTERGPGIKPVKVVEEDENIERKPYEGPNIILVRFGGGVRRRETIASAEHTYCPFIYHELARKQGMLFDNVEITSQAGVQTSHGEGTLYILTGHYHHYEDISSKLFGARFEPVVPTVFEYLRKYYDIPEHQTQIINGEDRIDEEFYTFSNNHQFGVSYRSTVLSLYRFKTYLLRQELAEGKLTDKEREKKTKELAKMESSDYRIDKAKLTTPELDTFWENWKGYYGKSGFVNPRGDRLLTTLALRSLKELRPKLMMINYQDPDYVHWGNPTFYTRAISIIDEGVREIYSAVQADEEYRDNTVFVIVPDCGRDNNRAMSVPFQHHFTNSRCAHEIFAIVAGPKKWVPRSSKSYTGLQQQTSVLPTIGELMGFKTPYADEVSLFEKV